MPPKTTEWIEMTGKEFICFINSPEGKQRFFIDMGNVVLETTKAETLAHKREKNHSDYLKSQEEHFTILSIYAVKDLNGCSGEEVIYDGSQNVEDEVISAMEVESLRTALDMLDSESRQMIYSLYLANERKTERELARETGVSQSAINKQKKKILKFLKLLVVKIQKSQQ